MPKKRLYFTTSQFAKLHGLNKRTLHYYDDIGLFSPVYKGENQYRYYDFSQSLELNQILMLKELNMSIDEMKRYMVHPSFDQFITLTDQKVLDIDQQIHQLQQTREVLLKKKQQLLLCQKIQDRYIEIKEYPQENIMVTDYDFMNQDVEKMFEYLKEVWNAEELRIGCGSFISIENVKQGQWDYKGLYAPLQKKKKQPHFQIKPKGRYIVGYLKGNWDKIPHFYQQILEYAEDNSVQLTGYAYEIGLNEFAIDDMNEYVTQIMIRIKE